MIEWTAANSQWAIGGYFSRSLLIDFFEIFFKRFLLRISQALYLVCKVTYIYQNNTYQAPFPVNSRKRKCHNNSLKILCK